MGGSYKKEDMRLKFAKKKYGMNDRDKATVHNFNVLNWKLQIWEQHVFLRQKESDNNLLGNLKKSLSI